ncbi:hypothetical protein [Lignipirellula cremea]|uniref:Uncharacterized protein n=1 Tax=Lignipirellula cremea TaxID=2528010 RepID=A0A518DSY3_9BACT|nr:hypothetical protein [Lignipirellula cremea]QDU94956.1 hypothetical protein Pla8534_27650 [Lignipirellula cremea]
MVKNFLFAVVSCMLLASVSFAGDDLLSGLDVNSIQDADISIEAASSDLDFDSLAGAAGEEKEGDVAIEACFRNFGYCGYGGYGGYGGFGYGCYSHTSYYCYRPVVYHTTCYAPVYTPCYTPVVRYWGCW